MALSENTNPIRLFGNKQNYEWGKSAQDSRVADLLSHNTHEKIDKTKQYAELWFSTHPNCPSSVELQNNEREPLRDYLHHSLPYIFKVLSVEKALPLQIHPDKTFAQNIYNENNKISKLLSDSNHKPEFMVAITDFELIAGIRPLDDIEFFLQTVPEFRDLVGEQVVNDIASMVKNGTNDKHTMTMILKETLCTILMCDEEKRLKYLDSLITNIKETNYKYIKNINNNNNIDLNLLIIRLQNDYPNDIGIFTTFFLNCINLKSGDGFFIDVNTPHAYLKGDCFECMPCSDNVINTAFVQDDSQPILFCQLVDYIPQKPNIIKANKITSNTVQYNASLQEVRLEITNLKNNQEEILKIDNNISKTEYHSTILILEGDGYFNDINISKGDAFLITPDTKQLKFQCRGNSLMIARCFTPVIMKQK